MNETIIKSKTRVQKHGEVFTPRKIVEEMLDMPGVKECCENLTATFLEPSAGEGAFLIAILERKLNMVANQFNSDLVQYENYSLLALSTLYGIELLEDNAQNCTMNMFQVFYDKYRNQASIHETKSVNKRVLDSAKVIIAANIRQGNFLTRLTPGDTPIIFDEWKAIKLRKTTKNIKIARTEYTLDEIYDNVHKNSGEMIDDKNKNIKLEQLSLFDDPEICCVESENRKTMRYAITRIVDVYKEEMEEVNED
ncbi:N-6 DNA methylase [Vagococcus carniphilus]|uniref:N-6 DNA methylase n=1 Tax=Vagococcus carniphilus TaxID=218144 RepID=A0AAW8UBP6_9ENTE|nr:N-6 DNA methylase [Vagococcus carniphilus]MDT2835257.1 N-6 DNA methylase [Vagococcus carniphilus]